MTFDIIKHVEREKTYAVSEFKHAQIDFILPKILSLKWTIKDFSKFSKNEQLQLLECMTATLEKMESHILKKED